MKKIVDFFKTISWKNKLTILYCSIIIVIVLFTSVVMFVCVHNYYIDQLTNSATQNLTQTQMILERIVSDNQKTLDTISRDKRLINILEEKEDFIDGSYSEFMKGYIEIQYLQNSLSELKSVYNISNISIYMQSGFVYNPNERREYSWERVMSSRWMKKMKNDMLGSVFLDNSYFDDELIENKSLQQIQLIRSSQNYEEIIGVLRISISADIIQNLLKNNKLSENSFLYLENSQGEPIVPIDDNYVNNIDKYKSFSTKLENSDLFLISKISMPDMMKMYYRLVIIIFVASIILMVIAVFFTKAITNTITKKLILLMEHMGKVKERNFEPIEICEINDDVDKSIETYNNILLEFKNILNEQKISVEKNKKLEMKILREQINPHFLYNTLELINSLAIVNNQSEISDVVRWISEYYKLSLNNGKDLLTVREEIRHTQIYLKLQNLRFNKNIEFIYDIPEDMFDISILKMIMQPLVENSVKHAFDSDISNKSNLINVVGYCENNYMYFIITDNGKGIEKDVIGSLLNKSSSGFGLKNVNDRIKMFYGDDCGISLESEFGKYTSIIVKIKKNVL